MLPHNALRPQPLPSHNIWPFTETTDYDREMRIMKVTVLVKQFTTYVGTCQRVFERSTLYCNNQKEEYEGYFFYRNDQIKSHRLY